MIRITGSSGSCSTAAIHDRSRNEAPPSTIFAAGWAARIESAVTVAMCAYWSAVHSYNQAWSGSLNSSQWRMCGALRTVAATIALHSGSPPTRRGHAANRSAGVFGGQSVSHHVSPVMTPSTVDLVFGGERVDAAQGGVVLRAAAPAPTSPPW